MADLKGKFLEEKELGKVNAYPTGFYYSKINIVMDKCPAAGLASGDRLEVQGVPSGILLEAGVLESSVAISVEDKDGNPIALGEEIIKEESLFLVAAGAVSEDEHVYIKFTQA